MAAEAIGQVGHVAQPKPPKVGHSPTNPSNMQYELLITQYDNNHDEINQQAIVSYPNGTASAWQAETNVIIT